MLGVLSHRYDFKISFFFLSSLVSFLISVPSSWIFGACLVKHFSNMFSVLNNITHFFTYTYFKKIQTILLKLLYQTGPWFLPFQAFPLVDFASLFVLFLQTDHPTNPTCQTEESRQTVSSEHSVNNGWEICSPDLSRSSDDLTLNPIRPTHGQP